MRTINIRLNQASQVNYSISIGEGVASQISDFLSNSNARKAVVVTNETIYAIYKNIIEKIIVNIGVKVELCILKDGEKFKNQSSLDEILSCAFLAKLERNDKQTCQRRQS